MTRTVHVDVASEPYDVLIGHHLLNHAGALIKVRLEPPARRALIVCDDNLPPSLPAWLAGSLSSATLDVSTISIHASEPEKSLHTFERILIAAAEARLDRHDLIVALGGGIVGDIAGFAAATHRRGVRVVQCPTTLLAMVDASVGGKTGVNLNVHGSLLKNAVGSFHQPSLVLASIDTLASLDAREFRSGLAECIKHAMIARPWQDPDLWDWTARSIPALLAHEPSALLELIERNVRIKARIVARDVRETAPDGGRALLNLGHTFAHAIETLEHLSPNASPHDAPLLHGEAVALGLIAASATAAALGRVDQDFVKTVIDLVALAGLPTHVAGLPDPEVILQRMGHDKKSLGGRIRLILPHAPGVCAVETSPDPACIVRGISTLSPQ